MFRAEQQKEKQNRDGGQRRHAEVFEPVVDVDNAVVASPLTALWLKGRRKEQQAGGPYQKDRRAQTDAGPTNNVANGDATGHVLIIRDVRSRRPDSHQFCDL